MIHTKTYKFYLLIFINFLLLSSCVSRKKIAYFQETNSNNAILNFEDRILNLQPQDRLTINVSAQEQQAVAPFNLTVMSTLLSGGSLNGTASQQVYIVNSDGFIDFPVLGSVKVSGLSVEKLKSYLTNEIANYVKDPIVNVELINFKISVLGEVNRPGTFTIDDQSISLPKALGLAGDLTIYGKRKNVLVVREEPFGGITRNYIDLTDPEIMNSPYYYLRQNDVVYIEPNKTERQSSSYKNSGVYFSAASILISIVSLLVLISN